MRKSLLTEMIFAFGMRVAEADLERAAEIDPVEAEDHVGGFHRRLRIRRDRAAARDGRRAADGRSGRRRRS